MARLSGKIQCVLVAMVLASGCATSPWTVVHVTEPETDGPTVEAATPLPTDPAYQEQTRAREMQEVMAELHELGAVDSAAQESLMTDLRQVDPELWPSMLKQFRATAEYRRRHQQQAAAPSLPPGQHPPEGVDSSGMQAAQYIVGPNDGRPMPLGRLPVADAAANALVEPPSGNYPSTLYPPMPGQPLAQPTDQHVPTDMSVDMPGESQFASAPVAQEDWREHLSLAARSLEAKVSAEAETQEQIAEHARLRLIYMLAGQRDKALSAIPAKAPATEEFWSKELFGLDLWLDTARTPDAAQRTAEAKQALDDALARLSETAPLEVRNMAFCTKIESYGCTENFFKYDFAPQQEVLLYAEIENFVSEETSRGAHTALRSSYLILDSRGQQVAEHKFTNTEEYCRQPRRDFFIGYHLRLPERIYPGKHTLQLTIEDINSEKLGQSSIEFWIKEPGD